MAILGRLKRSRVDEDEDEEIDGDDEDDVNDDDDDDEEAGGGGLTGKLGKLRGLGKMSGVGGMLGKVMKRGSEDDDEDEDDYDDDDDSSSVSVAPAPALDLSENTGIADSAVEPGPEAGSDATPPVEANVEGAIGDAADAVPAENEEKADYIGLGDMPEEKLEVDPFLRDLALSQDDTTAEQLLDELTAFLNQLE